LASSQRGPCPQLPALTLLFQEWEWESHGSAAVTASDRRLLCLNPSPGGCGVTEHVRIESTHWSARHLLLADLHFQTSFYCPVLQWDTRPAAVKEGSMRPIERINHVSQTDLFSSGIPSSGLADWGIGDRSAAPSIPKNL